MKTERCEEFVNVGIAGRGRNDVSAGLQRLIAPAEHRFQPSHLLQVLGAKAAIDGRQSSVDLGRPQQIRLRFHDPRRCCQDGHRLRCQVRRLCDGFTSLLPLALHFVSTRQPEPLVCQSASRQVVGRAGVRGRSQGQADFFNSLLQSVDRLKFLQFASQPCFPLGIVGNQFVNNGQLKECFGVSLGL